VAQSSSFLTADADTYHKLVINVKSKTNCRTRNLGQWRNIHFLQ